MKITTLVIGGLAAGVIGFTSCSDQLAKDVEPLAESMCHYIELQNNLKKALSEHDTLDIVKYQKEQQQLQIEMTIQNQEFQAKYGEKITDQEFGKKFKKAMNKALINCPHLSPEDRDRMEGDVK